MVVIATYVIVKISRAFQRKIQTVDQVETEKTFQLFVGLSFVYKVLRKSKFFALRHTTKMHK